MALTLESFAKVNLFLEVLGRRSDGYHDLSTVMQSVSIADTIRIEEGDRIEVTADLPEVPDGEGNIAWKAAAALGDFLGERRGCKIFIKKRIPVEAGLGGGSGNAAAVLCGLTRLWGAALPLEELARIGAAIGSDVPFFLYGGTRLCEGRGEIVRSFEPIPASTRFLLVTPPVRLGTSFVYEEFDTIALTGSGTSSKMKRVLGPVQDQGKMLHCLFNRLEEAVLPSFPEIREIRSRMESFCPAGVFMSGSGPTLFGLLPDSPTDEEGLLPRFGDCRFATVAHPTFSGYRILPEDDAGL